MSSVRMQSTARMAALRASPLFRPQRPASSMLRSLHIQQSPVLRMQASKRMMAQKEEHSAHTISQRIRSLKKLPVELWPLFIVMGAAIGAAAYSIIRKFYTDRTLRLYRTGPNKDH